MKIAKVAFVLATLAAPAFCGEFNLHLTPDNTKIDWTLADVLHTVHGTFRLKSGDIRFDPDSGVASGKVVIDATSGESGSGARDGRMHKNVLESSKYPEAVFTPEHMEGKLAMQGTSNVKLHGILRIHGVDHEMAMDVQANAAPERITAEIGFDVPYVVWGMKDPSTLFLKVDKKVRISIHIDSANLRSTASAQTESAFR